VQREIKLDGGEITLLKAIGVAGTPIMGKTLAERTKEMESAQLIDTLEGLIGMGYVLSSKVNVVKMEDIERSIFRVNPSYARELREAMNPSRRRDEERTRRRRRG
jgi:hypothetical protein